MLQGKGSLFSVVSGLGILLLLATLTLSRPTVAHANEPAPTPNHGNCITCHEDLYFLHDTGNWFCIRESPMRCVDCHGGEPSSLKPEVAHASRDAHPIVNEDVSKCQECHPAESDARVTKFDQVAGISNVLVTVRYQPKSLLNSEQIQQVQPSERAEYSGWISAMEIITPILISGLVLFLYLVHHRGQNKPINRSRK